MDNYALAREAAKKCFLAFPQGALCRRWGLREDASALYTEFLGRDYAVSKTDGTVTRRWDGREAGFEETLSIFDLLCREGPVPVASPKFAQVNSLRNGPSAAGVDPGRLYSRYAQRFEQSPEAFVRSCAALGGERIDFGDIGYEFPVFRDLKLRLKFYRADEEFPAASSLFWNENALDYLQYETMFYVMGFLYASIIKAMEE